MSGTSAEDYEDLGMSLMDTMKCGDAFESMLDVAHEEEIEQEIIMFHDVDAMNSDDLVIDISSSQLEQISQDDEDGGVVGLNRDKLFGAAVKTYNMRNKRINVKGNNSEQQSSAKGPDSPTDGSKSLMFEDVRDDGERSASGDSDADSKAEPSKPAKRKPARRKRSMYTRSKRRAPAKDKVPATKKGVAGKAAAAVSKEASSDGESVVEEENDDAEESQDAEEEDASQTIKKGTKGKGRKVPTKSAVKKPVGRKGKVSKNKEEAEEDEENESEEEDDDVDEDEVQPVSKKRGGQKKQLSGKKVVGKRKTAAELRAEAAASRKSAKGKKAVASEKATKGQNAVARKKALGAGKKQGKADSESSNEGEASSNAEDDEVEESEEEEDEEEPLSKRKRGSPRKGKQPPAKKSRTGRKSTVGKNTDDEDEKSDENDDYVPLQQGKKKLGAKSAAKPKGRGRPKTKQESSEEEELEEEEQEEKQDIEEQEKEEKQEQNEFKEKGKIKEVTMNVKQVEEDSILEKVNKFVNTREPILSWMAMSPLTSSVVVEGSSTANAARPLPSSQAMDSVTKTTDSSIKSGSDLSVEKVVKKESKAVVAEDTTGQGAVKDLKEGDSELETASASKPAEEEKFRKTSSQSDGKGTAPILDADADELIAKSSSKRKKKPAVVSDSESEASQGDDHDDDDSDADDIEDSDSDESEDDDDEDSDDDDDSSDSDWDSDSEPDSKSKVKRSKRLKKSQVSSRKKLDKLKRERERKLKKRLRKQNKLDKQPGKQVSKNKILKKNKAQITAEKQSVKKDGAKKVQGKQTQDQDTDENNKSKSKVQSKTSEDKNEKQQNQSEDKPKSKKAQPEKQTKNEPMIKEFDREEKLKPAVQASGKAVPSKMAAPLTASGATGINPCRGPRCTKPSLPASVYCSGECIRQHALESIRLLGKGKPKPAGAGPSLERIVVLERKTGKLVTGPAAPTEATLQSWLTRHPTFEVLQPSAVEKKKIPPKEVKPIPPPPAKESIKMPSRPEPAPVKEEPILPRPAPAVGALGGVARVAEVARGVALGDRVGGGGGGVTAVGGGPGTSSVPRGAPDPARISIRNSLRETLLARANESDDVMVSGQEMKHLALEVEEQLHSYCGAQVSTKYKHKYRTLITHLEDRKNKGLFRKVLYGEIKPYNLVRLSSEALGSKEYAYWKEPTLNKHMASPEKVIEPPKISRPPETVVSKAKSPFYEPPLDYLSSLTLDTTSQHGRHFFDINCKVCTGKVPEPLPPHDDEPAVAAPPTRKIPLLPDPRGPRPGVEQQEGGMVDIARDPRRKGAAATVTVKAEELKVDVLQQGPVVLSSSSVDSLEAVVEDPELWKGSLYAHEVAKVLTTAHLISGLLPPLLEELSDIVVITGRLPPENIFSYLSQIKRSGTTSRDVSIIYLKAANADEDTLYAQLFHYLDSRNRCGVVGQCATSKYIKDMYIVPLPSHKLIPGVLLPFEGPGLAESRPDLLLGVIVKHATASKKLQQAAAAATAAKDSSSGAKGVLIKSAGLEVKRGATDRTLSDSVVLDNDSMDISPSPQDKDEDAYEEYDPEAPFAEDEVYNPRLPKHSPDISHDVLHRSRSTKLPLPAGHKKASTVPMCTKVVKNIADDETPYDPFEDDLETTTSRTTFTTLPKEINATAGKNIASVLSAATASGVKSSLTPCKLSTTVAAVTTASILPTATSTSPAAASLGPSTALHTTSSASATNSALLEIVLSQLSKVKAGMIAPPVVPLSATTSSTPVPSVTKLTTGSTAAVAALTALPKLSIPVNSSSLLMSTLPISSLLSLPVLTSSVTSSAGPLATRDWTTSMLTTLAATSAVTGIEEQRRLLSELTEKIREQKEFLERQKDEMSRSSAAAVAKPAAAGVAATSSVASTAAATSSSAAAAAAAGLTTTACIPLSAVSTPLVATAAMVTYTATPIPSPAVSSVIAPIGPIPASLASVTTPSNVVATSFTPSSPAPVIALVTSATASLSLAAASTTFTAAVLTRDSTQIPAYTATPTTTAFVPTVTIPPSAAPSTPTAPPAPPVAVTDSPESPPAAQTSRCVEIPLEPKSETLALQPSAEEPVEGFILGAVSGRTLGAPDMASLAPSIHQMLSGKSFEHLKNIVANVTAKSASQTNAAAKVQRKDDDQAEPHGSERGRHAKLSLDDPASQPKESLIDFFNRHGDMDYRPTPIPIGDVDLSIAPPPLPGAALLRGLAPLPPTRPPGPGMPQFRGVLPQCRNDFKPPLLCPDGPEFGQDRRLLSQQQQQQTGNEFSKQSRVPLLPDPVAKMGPGASQSIQLLLPPMRPPPMPFIGLSELRPMAPPQRFTCPRPLLPLPTFHPSMRSPLFKPQEEPLPRFPSPGLLGNAPSDAKVVPSSEQLSKQPLMESIGADQRVEGTSRSAARSGWDQEKSHSDARHVDQRFDVEGNQPPGNQRFPGLAGQRFDSPGNQRFDPQGNQRFDGAPSGNQRFSGSGNRGQGGADIPRFIRPGDHRSEDERAERTQHGDGPYERRFGRDKQPSQRRQNSSQQLSRQHRGSGSGARGRDNRGRDTRPDKRPRTQSPVDESSRKASKRSRTKSPRRSSGSKNRSRTRSPSGSLKKTDQMSRYRSTLSNDRSHDSPSTVDLTKDESSTDKPDTKKVIDLTAKHENVGVIDLTEKKPDVKISSGVAQSDVQPKNSSAEELTSSSTVTRDSVISNKQSVSHNSDEKLPLENMDKRALEVIPLPSDPQPLPNSSTVREERSKTEAEKSMKKEVEQSKKDAEISMDTTAADLKKSVEIGSSAKDSTTMGQSSSRSREDLVKSSRSKEGSRSRSRHEERGGDTASYGNAQSVGSHFKSRHRRSRKHDSYDRRRRSGHDKSKDRRERSGSRNRAEQERNKNGSSRGARNMKTSGSGRDRRDQDMDSSKPFLKEINNPRTRRMMREHSDRRDNRSLTSGSGEFHSLQNIPKPSDFYNFTIAEKARNDIEEYSTQAGIKRKLSEGAAEMNSNSLPVVENKQHLGGLFVSGADILKKALLGNFPGAIADLTAHDHLVIAPTASNSAPNSLQQRDGKPSLNQDFSIFVQQLQSEQSARFPPLNYDTKPDRMQNRVGEQDREQGRKDQVRDFNDKGDSRMEFVQPRPMEFLQPRSMDFLQTHSMERDVRDVKEFQGPIGTRDQHQERNESFPRRVPSGSRLPILPNPELMNPQVNRLPREEEHLTYDGATGSRSERFNPESEHRNDAEFRPPQPRRPLPPPPRLRARHDEGHHGDGPLSLPSPMAFMDREARSGEERQASDHMIDAEGRTGAPPQRRPPHLGGESPRHMAEPPFISGPPRMGPFTGPGSRGADGSFQQGEFDGPPNRHSSDVPHMGRPHSASGSSRAADSPNSMNGGRRGFDEDFPEGTPPIGDPEFNRFSGGFPLIEDQDVEDYSDNRRPFRRGPPSNEEAMGSGPFPHNTREPPRQEASYSASQGNNVMFEDLGGSHYMNNASPGVFRVNSRSRGEGPPAMDGPRNMCGPRMGGPQPMGPSLLGSPPRGMNGPQRMGGPPIGGPGMGGMQSSYGPPHMGGPGIDVIQRKDGPPRMEGPLMGGPPPGRDAPPRFGGPRMSGPPMFGSQGRDGPPHMGGQRFGGPPQGRDGPPHVGDPQRMGGPPLDGPPHIAAPAMSAPPQMDGPPRMMDPLMSGPGGPRMSGPGVSGPMDRGFPFRSGYQSTSESSMDFQSSSDRSSRPDESPRMGEPHLGAFSETEPYHGSDARYEERSHRNVGRQSPSRHDDDNFDSEPLEPRGRRPLMSDPSSGEDLGLGAPENYRPSGAVDRPGPPLRGKQPLLRDPGPRHAGMHPVAQRGQQNIPLHRDKPGQSGRYRPESAQHRRRY